MKSLLQAVVLALIGVAFANAAQAKLADDVLGELATMKQVYRAEYAPTEWKRTHAGYDLDVQYAKAVAAVQSRADLTTHEAREILKTFIYAMQDYHTSISFVSTETASLPFAVKSAGDRYFIEYIDRAKLPESSFPFQIGDEVVSFDGQPTAQAVAGIQGEITGNVPSTDKAIAELRLTGRSAARGLTVPQGPVTIEIKSHQSGKIAQAQLIWEYTPENINARSTLGLDKNLDLSAGPVSVFHPMMDVKISDNMIEGNPYDLGAKKTFTPDLGKKVWETDKDDSFYAYIYRTDDRKLIGYVRIAAYVTRDYKKAVSDFAKIIARFESTTDAMVIDQVNNPGGSVFYLYSLASMLTDAPLKTPLHRMSINQSNVAEALKNIDTLKNVKNDEDARKVISDDDLQGFPSSYEVARFTLAYSQFLVNEWNQGRRLTQPYWIGGADHINPAATHYTKPILLLTNHLDFSGGDFFPAIMQDNKRVTILGSRTAGAGGYVADIEIPNNIGVASFRVTESIAERVNGNPIENLGVTPDVVYEMTADDLSGNYAPYVKLIQSTVSGMVP